MCCLLYAKKRNDKKEEIFIQTTRKSTREKLNNNKEEVNVRALSSPAAAARPSVATPGGFDAAWGRRRFSATSKYRFYSVKSAGHAIGT